ncbi:hypothetical protein BDY21DRAFT_372514 [Lineolata rhizophorae]|uniref:Uncharacterized protein n=1 Tax=Lineolata rhizophorae TaxID=578093 RepID=A0A6A6NYR0_9PEZI|nr:hypothetical protein BDY21DRAFT_372514 [Lineolata rhizophorae]
MDSPDKALSDKATAGDESGMSDGTKIALVLGFLQLICEIVAIVQRFHPRERARGDSPRA